MNKDPSSDIWRILDISGLDAGTFLTGKKSMAKIVTEVRQKLHNELTAYIKQREENSSDQ